MKRFNYKDLPIISKLIIGLTFSLFLATATGYFILGNVARNSLIETISESTLLFSQELTNEIDRSIDNRIDFWRIHAAEPQFIENIKTSNNQLEKITNLEQLIEERDSQWIKTEIPRAEWMLELYNNEDSVELRKTIKLFEQQNGHLVFSEVFVTNQKGMVTALSDWTTDYNQADEVWWQKAMEDGLYIGETTFDESSQVRALEIGIRVEDENNRPIGVMKVLLNVEDLFKIITDIITENQSAQSISAKIFDENNELIYSTSNDYDPKVIKEVTNYFRYEPHNIHYLLVEKKNNGKDFFIHQNLDQKELASKLNWLLILEQESKEMFAPINKQNKLFIFIILITAIILFSYNIFISRLIISPITNLLNTIIEVKNGNRNKKAKVEGNDEVGILAKNFNEMSDKLNKLDKLKTEFLSIAAHQLRTPMGIIRWDLELIRDGGLGKISKPIKKKIVEIHETTLRVINLVNDLLNLTHIEQGKFGNNPTLVNIRKIIDSSVKSENNILKKKNMVVEIKTTNKIPSITIDAEKLREVIENFISNSIKYSKIENAKLVIELKDLENDIEISFMDNGIGIPKEAQKNIFERFFRADNAKATDATGSGLGLYLTKQYVEKWGGEVSFTSDEKNTNFKVRIPKKPNQF